MSKLKRIEPLHIVKQRVELAFSFSRAVSQISSHFLTVKQRGKTQRHKMLRVHKRKKPTNGMTVPGTEISDRMSQ